MCELAMGMAGKHVRGRGTSTCEGQWLSESLCTVGGLGGARASWIRESVGTTCTGISKFLGIRLKMACIMTPNGDVCDMKMLVLSLVTEFSQGVIC